MAGRPWTAKEERILQKHFGKIPAWKIGEKISRTEKAVYQRALFLGITNQRDRESITVRKRQIRELLAKGWSDSEIAAAVGMDRRGLTEMRTRMGLPASGRNERYRRKVAQRTIEQCRKAGVQSLGELRAKRLKQAARKLGWPDHLSARSVQIVETLYREGPMTRRQITAAIGLRWLGSRKTLKAKVPGGSYMAELQRAGLVIRLPSAITHKGSGNHEDLYMVALEIEPCREKPKPSPSARSKR